jgi:AAA domain, putative AbiEii toxin, Type IV TA system
MDAITTKNWFDLIEGLTAPFTRRLDGRTRFAFVDPQPSGDLKSTPTNHLWALFEDDSAREKVRRLTEDAFGLHFVIDPTNMEEFSIRLSTRSPRDLQEEKMLVESTRQFFSNARPITSYSDGIQAFVGLAVSILSLPLKVILIDEPEAFLHPPLARRLGSALARLSRERGASLVVATHSADFVMGCVEVGETTVIRLTYEDTVATVRSLTSEQVAQLTRDPLLRSAEVLSALFHRAALVTEADADRAFYNEMNYRLQAAGRGIDDCLFLNAQNNQTISRIVGPLRRIGVPAAAIVDLDTIRVATTAWEILLDGCQVPLSARNHLQAERAYLDHVFNGLVIQGSLPPIKSQGIRALQGQDLTRALLFLSELAKFGLFLLPGGDLEHAWLPSLPVPRDKSMWLVNVFMQIGQSEDEAGYLKASSGDIWDFLDGVAAWIDSPNRLGMS